MAEAFLLSTASSLPETWTAEIAEKVEPITIVVRTLKLRGHLDTFRTSGHRTGLILAGRRSSKRR